jgi:hypothetical protein
MERDLHPTKVKQPIYNRVMLYMLAVSSLATYGILLAG